MRRILLLVCLLELGQLDHRQTGVAAQANPSDPLAGLPPLDGLPPLTDDDFDFMPNMPTNDPFLNLMTGNQDNFRPVNNWASQSSSNEPVPAAPIDGVVGPSPSDPVDLNPNLPVEPFPSDPVNNILNLPVDSNPGVPIDAFPSAPVNPNPSVPVDTIPGIPVNPISNVPVDPKPSPPVAPKPSAPVVPSGIPVQQNQGGGGGGSAPVPSGPQSQGPPPGRGRGRGVFVVSKANAANSNAGGVLAASTASQPASVQEVVRQDVVDPAPMIPAAQIPRGNPSTGGLPPGQAKKSSAAASWIPVVYPSGRPEKVEQKLKEAKAPDTLGVEVQQIMAQSLGAFSSDKAFRQRLRDERKRIQEERKRMAQVGRQQQQAINQANRFASRQSQTVIQPMAG